MVENKIEHHFKNSNTKKHEKFFAEFDYSATLMPVTYAQFVAYCIAKSGIENKSEFARSLARKKDEKYIINISNGTPPGRQVLEDAARLAGLKFEDCIVIPEEKEDPLLHTFRMALASKDKRTVAEKMAADLEGMPEPKKKKYGGRQRKPS